MPDRDVFDRHVIRCFQSASRRMLGSDSDPGALKLVIGALKKLLRANGCAGFDEIVDIVVDALRCDDRGEGRHRAHARLDRVCLAQGEGVTEMTAQAARRRIAAPETLGHVDGEGVTTEELRITVALHLLADLADAWMCPATMLPELVEAGIVSFQVLHARRERSKALVAAAPETRRLAEQLLADPSGISVSLPRLQGTKMTQAEILVTSLTD